MDARFITGNEIELQAQYKSKMIELFDLKKKRPLIREEINALLRSFHLIHTNYYIPGINSLKNMVGNLQIILDVLNNPSDDNFARANKLKWEFTGFSIKEPMFQENISELTSHLMFLLLYSMIFSFLYVDGYPIEAYSCLLTILPAHYLTAYTHLNDHLEILDKTIAQDITTLGASLSFFSKSVKPDEEIYYIVGNPIRISRFPLALTPHITSAKSDLRASIPSVEIANSFPYDDRKSVLVFKKYSEARAYATSQTHTHIEEGAGKTISTPAIFWVTLNHPVENFQFVKLSNHCQPPLTSRNQTHADVNCYLAKPNQLNPIRGIIQHPTPFKSYVNYGPYNFAAPNQVNDLISTSYEKTPRPT